MATTNPDTEWREQCPDCGRSTPHAVRVELRTESTKPDTAKYSREPYRVSVCRVCGASESRRMNNA